MSPSCLLAVMIVTVATIISDFVIIANFESQGHQHALNDTFTYMCVAETSRYLS